MKKLLVGNWKMNKNGKEAQEFTDEFNSKFTDKREAWIASQAIFVKLVINSGIKAGIQNCSEHVSGAYTGEVSPRSFKEMGGHFVILGHSERRQYFGETSKGLNAKIRTALAEGLDVIYCVGETLTEREANQTLSLIEDQIHQGLNDQSLANASNLIVAYEPVWAIGTGRTASAAQAQEAHAFLRSELAQAWGNGASSVRLLYGGSVKPDNASELMGQKDVDGVLVGGASLEPDSFLAIAAAGKEC